MIANCKDSKLKVLYCTWYKKPVECSNRNLAKTLHIPAESVLVYEVALFINATSKKEKALYIFEQTCCRT